MKGLRFMCAAMAAFVAFAACQKSPVASEQAGYKSVVVKLDNVLTKSIDDTKMDGAETLCNSLCIFFADEQGNLYKGMTPEGEEAAHYFVDKQDEYEFHYLSTNVTKVVVVANYFKNAESVELYDLKKVNDIKKLKLNIEEQQDVKNLAMYGEANLDFDHEDNTTHPKTSVYKANVLISPLVARIEVRTIGVDFESHNPSGNTLFKSITVNKIALFNFYKETDLTGNLENASYDGLTVNQDFDFTRNGWYVDQVFVDLEKKEGPLKCTPDNPSDTFPHFYYGYNIFPPDAETHKDTGYPRFYLDVTTENQVNVIEENRQVKTKDFLVDGAPIKFQAGNIYKIELIFPNDLLGTDLRCANITVTPMTWDKLVYPSTNW